MQFQSADLPTCLPRHTFPKCWPAHHYICHFKVPTCQSLYHSIFIQIMWICDLPTATYMYAISKCRPLPHSICNQNMPTCLMVTPHAFPKCWPVDLPTNAYAISKCRPLYNSVSMQSKSVDLPTCLPHTPSQSAYLLTCPPLHMPFQSADLSTTVYSFKIQKVPTCLPHMPSLKRPQRRIQDMI